MFWRSRAFSEYSASVRTFFGTLTIAPENDALLDALARIELCEKGTDFDTLTDAERFRVRCTVGGREITKYLKRVREGEKDRSYRDAFRYLFIAEPHQSDASSSLKKGRPHWHCLVHETDIARPLVLPHEFAVNSNGEPITDKYGNAFLSDTAFLKRQWKMGYSRFMLCQTPTAATYTTKYLTKEDTQVRIRASGNYGNGGSRDGVVVT